MRFLAIFDGLFFAWQWWEIALFKGKNRFAVGGVTSHWRFGEPLKTTLKFLRCYVGVPTAKNEAVLVAADSWYAPTDAWELY